MNFNNILLTSNDFSANMVFGPRLNFKLTTSMQGKYSSLHLEIFGLEYLKYDNIAKAGTDASPPINIHFTLQES